MDLIRIRFFTRTRGCIRECESFFAEATAHIGTNRLIKSLKDAGIEPGENVYAELGTDSMFYGPPQPLINAFRAFQIPEEYRELYGYPQLTPTAKEKTWD